MTRALPSALMPAVRCAGSAATMASRTSWTLVATLRSTVTDVLFVSQITRSFASRSTPVPAFRIARGVVGWIVSKVLALMVLLWAPPLSSANSIPAMVSVSGPPPAGVVTKVIFARVKLASRHSYSRSLPEPPSMMSAPGPPLITSSPAPPVRTLARSLPTIVSPKAEPVTLLKPDSSGKSLDSPPARLTTTASSEAEKSRVFEPLPPFRTSTLPKVRLFVPSLKVNVPSASLATVTATVTGMKSMVSYPSFSPPSTIASTPQPSRRM